MAVPGARRRAMGGGVATVLPSGVGGYTFEYRADQAIFSNAGLTPCVNGDTVQQWNDVSGNGHHLTQGTSGLRPLFNTGQINGKPAVTFDGVDDVLGPLTFTFTMPETIYIVFQHVTWTNNHLIFDGSPSAGKMFMSQGSGISGVTRIGSTGGNLDTAMGVGTWAIVEAQWATDGVSNGVLCKINNGTDNTHALACADGNGFGLGTGFVASANFQVAHIIGYHAIPSSGDRTSIRTFLNSLYNCY